jgi:hypothetical protein
VVNAKLYVEGAGPTDLERKQCREAFSQFLTAAGLAGRMPRVVACGARNDALRDFVTAMATRRPDERPLLLVDSEAPVVAGENAWQHLKRRDGWEQPAGTSDQQVFLMVQVMETWLVADRETLRREFGPDFIERHLASWPDLEAVPKSTILNALERATARCGAKAYAKGKRSFVLLGKLNPSNVENACPHARAFLTALRRL